MAELRATHSILARQGFVVDEVDLGGRKAGKRTMGEKASTTTDRPITAAQ